MRPAWSIIWFTVTSGLGYGLAGALALTVALRLGPPPSGRELLFAGVAALAAIVAGLLSSSLHLANPRNAWRAFSRWRTSWLAREAVLAVLSLPAIAAFLAVASSAGPESAAARWLGLLVFALALATVYATGMIYACLKTVRQWNNGLTPVNYVLAAAVLGTLALAVIGLHFGRPSAGLALTVAGLAGVGLVAKLAWYQAGGVGAIGSASWHGGPVGGSTIQTATGLTRGAVRLLDVGHSADTFLTREFGFRAEAEKIAKVRAAALLGGYVLPLLLAGGAGSGAIPAWWVDVALILAYAGMLGERWLFFAEARHAVMLYHGASGV